MEIQFRLILRLSLIYYYIVFFIEKGISLNTISNSTSIYPILYITTSIKFLSLSILIIFKKI